MNNTNELPSDAINCGKAAKILRCHPSAVWRWVEGGRLPGWRVGNRLYVSEADVRGQIRRVKPVSGPVPTPTAEITAMKARTARVLREFGLA